MIVSYSSDIARNFLHALFLLWFHIQREKMKSEKTVTEGMLVPCLMAGTDEWSTAEIIKIRPALTSSTDTDGVGDALDETKRLFYVHYVDFNKRLDCWVAEDRLDLANARLKGQEPVETKKEDAGGVAGRCFSPTPSASNLAASSKSIA